MENNLPIMAKKVWNMVRIVLFMLRKGISKGKLMLDLNFIFKRRAKLAGKAISNHHNGASNLQFSSQREYEFSCSNTPNYFFPIGRKHHRNHNNNNNNNNLFTCAHAPPSVDEEMNVVKAVLEMLNMNNSESSYSSSPALPGFGKSPMVKQLRVTDSPFPINTDDKDNMVDKKADEFIKRFYKQLRNQD